MISHSNMARPARRFLTKKQKQAKTRRRLEREGPPPKLPPTALEEVKIKARRIAKAERDERMDITLALTPVKTYMGGFTRPRDLRVSNWFPGGAYADHKTYESPSPSAYESHTVFLLESRHPVRHGIGRTETVEHIVGVCREGDLPAVLERMNSERAPREAMEAMDNARWPWMPAKVVRRVQWWGKDETPESILAQLAQEDAEIASKEALGEGRTDVVRVATKQDHGLRPHRSVTTELLQGGGSAVQQRMFHVSMRRSAEDVPDEGVGSFKARSEIPGSTWARPHRPSQDADDNVVPTYYVERKKQRSSVAERKEEEGGLMAELSAGILSEGVAAKTRAREEKIPVEVVDKDGTVRHPSGFEPPTPETDFHPAVAKTPTEEHPLLLTVKQLWDERPVNPEMQEVVSLDPRVERAFARRKIEDEVEGRRADEDAANVLADHARTEQGPSGTFDTLSSEGSTTSQERSAISTSSWDTPKRSPRWVQHPEDVVPSYYIERKRQRDSIAERKEEEGGLMAELNAGILGEGLSADMKHRDEKIPVEVKDPRDGSVHHPSGFKPPTPETHFHPTSAKPPTEDHPIVSTVKVPWTEVLDAKSGKSDASNPKGGRGFHTSALVRAMAMPDAALNLMSPGLAHPPQPVHASQEHEFDDDTDVNAPHEEEVDEETRAVRRQYLPTLGAEPFWRPLLTTTFSTRPLALSFARLARGLPRGLPFYASINNDDRKCRASFPARLRNLRLNRAHELTFELARILHGERGGPLGIRFSPEQRGRGVNGEGLEDPIPADKRMIKIGVGEWYKRAAEVKEAFEIDADGAEVADAVEVFGVDEHGMRTDGVAWQSPLTKLEDPNPLARVPEVPSDKMWPHDEKSVEDHFYRENKDKLAMALATVHRSVLRP